MCLVPKKKFLLSLKYLFCSPVLCSADANRILVLPIPKIASGPPLYDKTLVLGSFLLPKPPKIPFKCI